jgi:hypothetical protein
MGYTDKKRFLLEIWGGRPGRIRRPNTHQRLLIPLIGGVSTMSVCLASGLVSAKLRRYIGVRGRAYGARGDGSLRGRGCGRGRQSYRTLDWWTRGRCTQGTSECPCGPCLSQLFARVLPIRLLRLRSPLCEL